MDTRNRDAQGHYLARHTITPHHHHPVTRKITKLSLLMLVAHYLMHFTWHAYETMIHKLHLPDPAELGRDLGDTAAIPVVLVVLIVAAVVQWRLE